MGSFSSIFTFTSIVLGMMSRVRASVCVRAWVRARVCVRVRAKVTVR